MPHTPECHQRVLTRQWGKPNTNLTKYEQPDKATNKVTKRPTRLSSSVLTAILGGWSLLLGGCSLARDPGFQ
eukprot:9712345-Alexandrium_andersonii.AAC.1